MTTADRVAARYAALKDVQPFTWQRDIATFAVEGVTFEMAFKGKSIRHPKYGSISGFEASFYRKGDKGAPWQYRPTGEGKAMPVLSTVGAILKDFLVRRKPSYVWFVADEPSRVRLYNVLLRRLGVPGYEAEIGGEGIYTLRRTKSVFDP